MELKGNTAEEKIWNFLIEKGLSPAGAAGLMGNLYAESGLNPRNLQNSFERKLGYTDDSYTAAVDDGSYGGFVRDSAGYGLAQWTYWSRKEKLIIFVRSRKCSVGDLEAQLAFLMEELGGSYRTVLAVLKSARTVREASDAVLTGFEKPKDQSATAKERRAGYGQKYYDELSTGSAAEKGSGSNMGFTNSPLATCTMLSPNRTPDRNHAIDTITPHCFVGNVTAKRGCEVFQPTGRNASCNYVIGYDGSIGLCVEEKDRSFCTGGTDKNGQPIRVNGISGKSNDYQAVTIEVACDSTPPYAITEKAMDALVELCADICRRNGIPKLLWEGDKSLVGNVARQNITVHRWFANKACPGDYIYNHLSAIAARVNVRLGVSGSAVAPKPVSAQASGVPYTVRIAATDLNIRKGPGVNYGTRGHISPGSYTIVSEATGAGATKWGKLKSGEGWVSLDFCRKI